MTDQVTQFQQLLDSSQAAVSDKGTNNDINAVLQGIVNEKGEPKYSNVEDAIKALKASQEHISTLESENSQLRERTQTSATIEDIMAQLDSTKNNTGDSQQNFSVEDITGLVEKTLVQRESQQQAMGNLGSVKGKLSETFGDKADEVYSSKAKDLGLSVEMLDHLAAISPKAVMEYFGTKGSATGKNIQSSVNTDAFQQYNQAPEKAKPIMYGSNSEDIVSAWRKATENLN